VLASQPPPLAKGGIEGRDAEPEETEVVEYALGTTLLLPSDPTEPATVPVLPVRTDLGEGRVNM
jgi:hypothetical protein